MDKLVLNEVRLKLPHKRGYDYFTTTEYEDHFNRENDERSRPRARPARLPTSTTCSKEILDIVKRQCGWARLYSSTPRSAGT